MGECTKCRQKHNSPRTEKTYALWIRRLTIRAIQNAIMTGKSLAWVMDALVARLIPRAD